MTTTTHNEHVNVRSRTFTINGAEREGFVVIHLPMLGHEVVSLNEWTKDAEAVTVINGLSTVHAKMADAVAQVLGAGSYGLPEIARACSARHKHNCSVF